MYSVNDVRNACGARAAEYVQRKSTGGTSGQKGTRYEDHLAIFKIAEAAKEAFEKSSGTFDRRLDVTVYSQVPCFVDDLITRRFRSRRVVHYQAKNRTSTTWGTGWKSLRADFCSQARLSESRDLTCALVLVVSSGKNSKRLANVVPEKLKANTSVLYFPYHKRISSLLRSFPAFRGALDELAAGAHASDDWLDSIGTSLLGTWVDSGNQVTVRQVLGRMIRNGVPFVRPLKPVNRFNPRLKAALDEIPGFHYSLERGYMHWQFGRADFGCYRHPCGSGPFNQFAKRIVARQPATFEEIEGDLAP